MKDEDIYASTDSRGGKTVIPLKVETKADLLAQLKDLKAELALLCVAKVTGGQWRSQEIYGVRAKN
ncbi:hypothetical protein MTR_5g045550 [Medicago truncatula]|uniref:Uncharacterized protein n=1 Tax=Medicago truncatula TaxID=3880 RepID=G7JZ37_MEDTR|nr:hypothetical protein MTR_5g045550 [Medicago truncatula]